MARNEELHLFHQLPLIVGTVVDHIVQELVIMFGFELLVAEFVVVLLLFGWDLTLFELVFEWYLDNKGYSVICNCLESRMKCYIGILGFFDRQAKCLGILKKLEVKRFCSSSERTIF